MALRVKSLCVVKLSKCGSVEHGTVQWRGVGMCSMDSAMLLTPTFTYTLRHIYWAMTFFHWTVPWSMPPHLFHCKIYILGCIIPKTETAVDSETLEQLKHTTQLNCESHNYTVQLLRLLESFQFFSFPFGKL
jgi:hypothetical protein